MLRELSPFTLRLIVPSLVEAEADVDVNLIGRAGQEEQFKAQAEAVRSLFGISGISGSQQGEALAVLQRIVSAGTIITGASTTTERTVLADATTAADIAFQVERMLQTSPLTLLVNPNSMNVNYGVIQQYSNRTRFGFIFERWGETQPTISFSGSTGAFIAAANPALAFPGVTETKSPSGLQFASKRDSAAFQNFVALYHFYRNNGYIFDTVGRTEAPLMVGAIAIDYDQWTYIGHIESFEYTYDQNMQHRLEWSMEFAVDEMIDTAQSPIFVQPLVAPQPNPSWPARSAQSFMGRPDGLTGGNLSQGASFFGSVSGTEQFAETPLDVLLPSGITS
jgi:hypothetical protein